MFPQWKYYKKQSEKIRKIKPSGISGVMFLKHLDFFYVLPFVKGEVRRGYLLLHFNQYSQHPNPVNIF